MDGLHSSGLASFGISERSNPRASAKDARSLCQSFARDIELMAHNAKNCGHEDLASVMQEMACLLLAMNASQKFGR